MNRLLHVDALKGILILLVVLGHSIQYVLGEGCFENRIWNYIYSFHMPCFIAVSGYFAPKVIHGVDKLFVFIWRRFQQLIIPMFIWQTIYIILPPFSKNVSLISFFDCGNYWFLWALFFISLIYSFVVYISNKLHTPAIALHILVSVFLIGIMVLMNYHQHGAQYIAYYYPYFVIGYYLNTQVKPSRISIKWFWLAFFLWLLGATYWRMHEVPLFLSSISFISPSFMIYAYRYIVGFVAVFAIYGLSAYYLSKEYCLTSILARMGALSLGIYTIHILFLKILRPYIANAQMSNTLCIVVLFVILVVTSIALVYSLYRNKVTSKLLLGKLK